MENSASFLILIVAVLAIFLIGGLVGVLMGRRNTAGIDAEALSLVGFEEEGA